MQADPLYAEERRAMVCEGVLNVGRHAAARIVCVISKHAGVRGAALGHNDLRLQLIRACHNLCGELALRAVSLTYRAALLHWSPVFGVGNWKSVAQEAATSFWARLKHASNRAA